MDGKARYLDNPRAFSRTGGVHALDMSRLWRSLKYECVYLHAWETGSQAKAGVGRCPLVFCCAKRCRVTDHLLQPPAAPRHSSGKQSPGLFSDPPQTWRTTTRHGLLQRNRNRSAGAGSRLTHPEICPRLGEWLKLRRQKVRSGRRVRLEIPDQLLVYE